MLYPNHTTQLFIKYYFSVDVNCDGNQLLTLGSQGEVSLFTPELKKLNFFKPHDKATTQAAFAKSDPHLIYTSSYDGTIKLWDSRSPDKCKLEFKDQSTQSGPPSKSLKPVLCFDTTGANSLICAGTEKTGSDSYILFWDARSSNLMGGYWGSHSDDVTCIKFNPGKRFFNVVFMRQFALFWPVLIRFFWIEMSIPLWGSEWLPFNVGKEKLFTPSKKSF